MLLLSGDRWATPKRRPLILRRNNAFPPSNGLFLVHWALWYFPPSVTGHHCISGHRFPAIHRTGSARYHVEPTSILLSYGYSLLSVLSRCITIIYWRNIRDRWGNPALEVSSPWGPARSRAGSQPAKMCSSYHLLTWIQEPPNPLPVTAVWCSAVVSYI